MEITQHVYTSGARFDDFRKDFQNIFLSSLCSPSIVFVVVKNKFTSFFFVVCTLIYHRNDVIKCS